MVLMLPLVLSCLVAQDPAPQPPTLTKGESFLKDEEEWRKARNARLTSPSGWLTLVGLSWLSEGANAFGSDPANPVPLPEKKSPARAGVFILEHGMVRVEVAPGAGLMLAGKPLSNQILKSDAEGKPDILVLGDLSFYVIKRGDRFAIRVKDSRAPTLLGFKGMGYFSPDPAFRVTAEFVAYDHSKTLQIPTILGTTEPMQAPGYVKFKLKGKHLTLEPVIEDPADPQLFFIFRDRTSGKVTYPAGRFLYSAMPKDGKITLDFNQAYNPPCAFSPYATCPLPPPQNQLPVAITAGEKKYSHH